MDFSQIRHPYPSRRSVTRVVCGFGPPSALSGSEQAAQTAAARMSAVSLQCFMVSLFSSVYLSVHEVRSVPDGIDLDFEIDTRGEDVFAQYVNPDQCRLVAFDGYFVPQGDGACRSFARGELHRKSGRGRIVGIGDQVGAFQMRGTGDDVGGLYVLEIIFVGTDDRRFAPCLS